MMSLTTRSARAMALAVALTSGSSVWAQRPGEGVARAARPNDLPAAGVISPRENDRRIARRLEIDHKMIFECAKIGKERSANSAVRTFADAMTVEHRKCLDDLKAIAKDTKDDGASASATRDEGVKNSLGDTTPDRRRTAVLIQDEGKSRASGVIFRPADFLAVDEDVYNHLQKTMKKEWEAVSAEEFDRAFMRHVVMAHEMLLATMKSVRPTASTELRKSLDAGIEKLEGRLKSARELCDQVRAAKPR